MIQVDGHFHFHTLNGNVNVPAGKRLAYGTCMCHHEQHAQCDGCSCLLHDLQIQHEPEEVEITDKNGEVKIYLVLREGDFEGRQFAIMALPEDLEDPEDELDFSVFEIIQKDQEEFILIEDPVLMKMVIDHFDALLPIQEEDE